MADNEKIINDDALGETTGGVKYDNFFTYVVRYGDTLAGIAAFYGVTIAYLANLNNIPYPYILKVGQQLLIPKIK